MAIYRITKSLTMKISKHITTAALILFSLTTQQCCCFILIKDGTINRLLVHSQSELSEEVQSSTTTQPPNFSATATFNHDITRTLFPPLFFTLYHKYSNQNEQDDQEFTIRQHLKRPSPFEDPSSAQTAERMLRRMMENRYRSDGRTVCPDSRTFNLVAGSYGRLRCKNSARHVPNNNMIGVIWEEEPKLNPQYRLHINNNNMDEVIKQHKMISMTSTDKLQELLQLQLCLCHYEGWPDEIRPSVDMFNRVLRRLAWRSGSIELNSLKQTSDAEQAIQWLQFMNSTLPQQLTLEGMHDTICPPDPVSMSFAIEALTSHRVQAYSEREDTSKYTPTSTSNISITEMANEMNIPLECTPIPQEDLHSVLQHADELIAKQEEMYKVDSNDKSRQALAHSYKCLLEGLGRYAVTSESSQNDAIKRAYNLLCRLEALCDAPSSSYASVILALSISNRPSAATVAEEALNRMLAKMSSDSHTLNVNDVSKAFSGCIAAYVKNNDAPNAEKILFQMIDLYESEDLGSEFVPEPRAFGTCIAAWSKYDGTAEKSNERGRKWVSSPRQRLYNADRAESILVELERVAGNEAAKNNNKYVLHVRAYNIAILARVQTLDTNTPKNKRSNEGILLHAQSILDHMELEGVPADPYTYSILLSAWTKQSCPGNEKAADYAEQLLRRRIEDIDISKIYSDDDPSAKTVDDVWPNVKHYSSVLKAHANCKSPAGAKKALSLLSEMEKRFYDAKVISDDDGDTVDFHVDRKDAAKPDLVCYSIVIDAFAKQKQLTEASSVAFRLLRAMEEKYHAGDTSMKPNNRIYSAIILSLVNSPYSGEESAKLNNAQRAWSLLDEMKANDVQPNSFTYNYIINCCAQEACHDEQRISFEIAIKAFQELRTMAASSNNYDENSCLTDTYHPDSFSYAFMLKACTNLLQPSPFRTKVATQIFKECCKSGYCNDEVIKRLRWCVDTENFYSLVGTATRKVQMDEIPSSWSRCSLPNKGRRNNSSSQ